MWQSVGNGVVTIIGGGVAGLSTAACLAELGVPYTVLDGGDAPFAGLRQLDPEMQLLTPPRFSMLPGMTPRRDAPTYERFGDVLEQFEGWRAARDLNVSRNVVVEKVERAGNRFRITSNGTPHRVPVSYVVNATGIITHPVVPPHTFTGRWQHSLTVRSADLAAAKRLVVVGAGMSAAEVIERWLDVRAPDSLAWLSTRTKVSAVPHEIFGVDIHYWLWAPEHFPGRFLGRRVGPERDLIIGRSIVRALRDKSITQVPPVKRYAGASVEFDGGARLEPDLLVFATGYRYATEHLGDLVELDDHGHPIVDRHSASTVAPNLYLLGLRFGRNVASSAIRGITRDARHVANQIAKQVL